MGRHSAPDDPDLDSADTTEFTPIAVDLTVPFGRHSQPAQDEFATVEINPDITPPPVAAPDAAAPAPPYASPPSPAQRVEQPGPAAERDSKAVKQADKQAREHAKAQGKADKADQKAAQKAERKQARGESSTRADLRMLRQNGAVRAQALAAVIVSFLLYTVVMLVIGRTDVYLQWLWTPIVLSGFLVGLVLDLGHRRANKS